MNDYQPFDESDPRKLGAIIRFQSELMSRKEAAAYLGLAEQTLAIWKTTGRYNLPVIKVGRLVKYRKSDLDRFITTRTQGG